MPPDTTTVTAADTVTPIYADKGFIAIVVHLAAVAALAFAHIQLNEANIIGLVVTIVTFVVAHKLKSGAALVALIRSQAAERYSIQLPAPTLPEVARALDQPAAGVTVTTVTTDT